MLPNRFAMHINYWGFSSVGRASRWQREGQRFDPANLHKKETYIEFLFLCTIFK